MVMLTVTDHILKEGCMYIEMTTILLNKLCTHQNNAPTADWNVLEKELSYSTHYHMVQFPLHKIPAKFLNGRDSYENAYSD